MQNFINGLKDAFQYKWLLALSLLCSVCVASLWSANIGAFFPILEVTLKGESLQDWSANRIKESEQKIAEYDQQLAALDAQLQAGQPDKTAIEQNELQQSRISSLQAGVRYS